MSVSHKAYVLDQEGFDAELSVPLPGVDRDSFDGLFIKDATCEY